MQYVYAYAYTHAYTYAYAICILHKRNVSQTFFLSYIEFALKFVLDLQKCRKIPNYGAIMQYL